MRISECLVRYFGIVQLLHLGALLNAARQVLQTGVVGFPAPPPAGGWSEAAMPFLIALGITDAILIIVSEIFVWGFFTGKTWWKNTGLIALAGSSATAWVFAMGTLPSGAWTVHPIQYGVLCVLFAPFGGLFLQLLKTKNHPSIR